MCKIITVQSFYEKIHVTTAKVFTKLTMIQAFSPRAPPTKGLSKTDRFLRLLYNGKCLAHIKGQSHVFAIV